MRFDVVTLFPEMFHGVCNESILKRAQDRFLIEIHFTQLRDFAFDKHRQVDDTPFGGGAGMVLKPEPMYRAVRSIPRRNHSRLIILDPAGEKFSQHKAKSLASLDQLILIAGHYEGFDARIYELADELISLGDFILTGGELAAMVIIDAAARMIPGVLGDENSAITDSFYDGKILESPQYTRPRNFEGMIVPEILLSGNHAKIDEWRKIQSLERTQKFRPDLL
ncbi:MAG: tRNA (guanosine(37)-N1)-methyltransferase TrmD [Selenomonadaceae bacterium]|nr:tRNA (guanosine(37)-N1)-methyltransferase TrmD [Selenomonadaceae bacterium]